MECIFFQWSAITTNQPAPSSSMITRVKQGNKFMTYSCPPEAEMIAEEENYEDTSVASSRESRV